MKRTLLTAVSLVAALGSNLKGQVTTATLYGTVQDPSGAVLVGATVSLSHRESGAAFKQSTGATGEFTFEFLPVGPYNLSIEMTGFKKLELNQLEFGAAQRLRRTFVLEVGSASDTVTVTGAISLVNAVSPEQRESISELEVKELPLARRDISQIVALGTGIRLDSGGRGNGFVLNGLGKGSASISMDGIDASASPELPQTNMDGGFNYIGVVSLEAAEEVQVSKGVFSAEYGRTLAGNINVITKSGTNNWHGSLFETFQAENLNARNQLLSNKPGLTYNQYGGSLGGPIRRDKIFLFGAFEAYRERSFRTIQGDVPTQAVRDQLIAAVPDFRTVLTAFPLPNQPVTNPNALVGRYLGSGSLRSDTDHFVIKPDILLWSGGRLSATYLRDNPTRIIPNLSPLNPQSFTGDEDRVAVSFSTFGPRWSAETRYGWNRADRDRTDGFWEIQDPNKPEGAYGGRRLPGININQLGIGIGGEFNFVGNAPTWTIEQKMAYNVGRHSLKFGGLFFRGHQGRSNIENPSFAYSTLADALLNIPATSTFTFGRPAYRGTYFNLGFFAQDDWRVNNKLVLNLGLRYDYFSNMVTTSIEGSGPPHIYTAPLNFSDFTLGPWRPVDNPVNGDPVNFGPRFGFAYDLDGQGKTVIRGGIGIMFIPINPTLYAEGTIVSPNQPSRTSFSRTESQALGIRYPAYNEDVVKLVSSGAALPSYQIVDPNIEASYAINYTLGVQRALTSTLMLETAFVANRGVKFFMDRRYNQVDRLTGLRPNPKLSDNLYFDNSESTYYVSWQSSLRKRYSRGLVGNMHYTYGKTINYGTGDLAPLANRSLIQDFFEFDSNRGRAFEDLTHNFVGDLVYSLPAMAQLPSAARLVVGGWQVSGVFRAQSGLPVTLTQPSSRDRSRPDVIDPQNVYVREGPQYLNPAAFARVPIVPLTGMPVRSGNVGRSAISEPGLWNLDFSIGKTFPIAEKARAQFRVDLYNGLNHTILSGLTSSINASTFGRLTGTRGARQVQLNLRVSF